MWLVGVKKKEEIIKNVHTHIRRSTRCTDKIYMSITTRTYYIQRRKREKLRRGNRGFVRISRFRSTHCLQIDTNAFLGNFLKIFFFQETRTHNTLLRRYRTRNNVSDFVGPKHLSAYNFGPTRPVQPTRLYAVKTDTARRQHRYGVGSYRHIITSDRLRSGMWLKQWWTSPSMFYRSVIISRAIWFNARRVWKDEIYHSPSWVLYATCIYRVAEIPIGRHGSGEREWRPPSRSPYSYWSFDILPVIFLRLSSPLPQEKIFLI